MSAFKLRPMLLKTLIYGSFFLPFAALGQASVVGLGLKLMAKKGETCPVVAQVWHFSPAEEAGIHPGDILWSIDGATTESLSPAEAEKRLNTLEGDKHAIQVGLGKRDVKLKVKRMKGKCLNGDCKTGRGTWDEPDARYEGDFVAGRFDGKGVMTYLSGNRHEGEYQNGKRQGDGKFIFSTGTVYEGLFENNNFNGKGKMRHASGETFDGDWHDDRRQGKGIGTWPNGDRYDGDWSNDFRNGQGSMAYADGSKYDGSWVNNKRHGFGKMSSFEGWYYEGNWSGDMKEGFGKLRTSTGERIEGNFIEDEPPFQPKSAAQTSVQPVEQSAVSAPNTPSSSPKTKNLPNSSTPLANRSAENRSAENRSLSGAEATEQSFPMPPTQPAKRQMPPVGDKNSPAKTRLLQTLDGFFENATAADTWLLDNQKIGSKTQRIDNLQGLALMTSTWSASSLNSQENFSTGLKLPNSVAIGEACQQFLSINGQLAQEYNQLASLMAKQLEANDPSRQDKIDRVQQTIGSLGQNHRALFEQARRLFF